MKHALLVLALMGSFTAVAHAVTQTSFRGNLTISGKISLTNTIDTEADITVCASGCDYTTVQAAVTAAVAGDIIEVTAGESFTENIVLPYKEGTDYITVRSSRWRELPPPGFRVNPTDHASLMPRIVATPTGDKLPALRAGVWSYKASHDGVDIDANTLAVDWSDYATPPDGTAVLVSAGLDYTIPAPLVAGTIYYVRDRVGQYSFKLAATLGGEPIDLTSVGSAGEAGDGNRPRITLALNAHHWKITGIEFTVLDANSSNYHLVMIGWDESTVASAPHHIDFDHVIIRGRSDAVYGSANCLDLAGSNLSLTDSYISHCKGLEQESHGILMVNTPGPVLIQNNYISAASIGILTGGKESTMPKQVATNITIRRNHIVKQGYYMYKSGAGAPTGACYYGQGSGAFYRDTTPSPNTCANGACYSCQSNATWAIDKTATYRNTNYLSKGGVEFKDCDTCVVENNVIEFIPTGPDGNNSCMMTYETDQGGLYHSISHVTLQNNWCKDTWAGINVIISGGSDVYETKNHDITVQNNLVTGIADFPRLSIHALASDGVGSPLYFRNGQEDVVVDHNTFRGGGSSLPSISLLFVQGPSGFGSLVPSYIKNNLLVAGTNGIWVESPESTYCTRFGTYFGTASSPKYFANNVFFGTAFDDRYGACNPVANLAILASESSVGFVSSTNHRLQSTSPFSAACESGCQFEATDNTDMGADIDALETLIDGVVEGVPAS